MEGGCSLWLQ